MALALSRHDGEDIVLHRDGKEFGRIRIVRAGGGKAMMAFHDFPADIKIDRAEVFEAKRSGVPTSQIKENPR